MHGYFVRILAVIALMVVVTGPTPSIALAQQGTSASPPEGVSGKAMAGEVVRVEDGDTVVLRFGGDRHTVDLIAADAPELPTAGNAGDCYADKSLHRLGSLLDDADRIWVERDALNRTPGGNVLRYLWLEDDDGRATLLNGLLIRHGYAALAEDGLNVRHVDALRAAQEDAWATGKGMWTACGGPHLALPTPLPTPEPVVTTCGTFPSFDAAQAYYYGRPDAQPYLDPNYDGRACEDWFGVDVPPTPVPTVPPAPTGGGSPGGGGGRTGYGGNDGVDYDCRDFATQAQAQAYFNGDGGSAYNNVDALDHNNNGIACDEYGLP